MQWFRRMIGRVAGGAEEDEPAYRCLRCGAGFEREQATCRECGAAFVAPVNPHEDDEDGEDAAGDGESA